MGKYSKQKFYSNMPPSALNSPISSLSKEDYDAWANYVAKVFSSSTFISNPRSSKQSPDPSNTLDLHGFTLHQAYLEVDKFLRAHSLGNTKLVTIITGKGGEIKRELPIWCEKYSFIRKVQPNFDSRNQVGSFSIWFFKK